MPAPTAAALLDAVDRLPLPERERRLARLARAEAGTPAFAALLDGLVAERAAEERGFARHLALLLATVAAAPGPVAALLTDPDPAVAGHAAAVAVRLPALHDVLVERVADLPRRVRRRLYRAVREREASTLAARLLDVARSRLDDDEAAALLVACPPDAVAAALPALAHAVGSWAALARRHPDAVVAHLRERLAGTPEPRRAQVWSEHGGVCRPLAVARPAALLDLLATSVAHVPLPLADGAVAGPLARADRERFLGLLADPRRPGRGSGGRSFWRTLHDAPDADVVAVARDLDPTVLPRFLRTLPPRRRPAVVAGLAAGGRLPTALLLGLVDLLPAAARHAEAARLLQRPEVADDPHRRVTVLARRPFAEVQERLWAATRRPDAEDRGVGYYELLRAAALARDPAVLGGVLAGLDRLRNEQDPVRAAALVALAGVPAWLVRAADVPAWVRVCVDAVEARDVSSGSLKEVGRIAGTLLREGAARPDPALTAGAVTVIEAMGQRPAVYVGGATRDLPRGAEERLLAALLPRLRSDADRGRFDSALSLAAVLGRRAWPLPALQALLDRARGAADDAVVRRAVALWLAPPATRSARVATVLAADSSTILLEPVRAAVERRPDLLDAVLTHPPRGRFAGGPGHTVPAFHPGPGVWPPRQLRAYAELLQGIVAGGVARPGWERVWAIRLRAALPGGTPIVAALAEPEGVVTEGVVTEVVVTEAALAGLGHTDDPAVAVATLLDHVDDDRARVAVPAVRRCLEALPAAAVAAPVARLLASPKVTTRKEAVRLAAVHLRGAAAPQLLAHVRAPDEHRDVRRAAVAAAATLLRTSGGDPAGAAAAVWEILAVAAADPAVATTLLATAPNALPERDRARYGRIVVDLCAPRTDRSDDDVRRALAAVAPWSPWLDAAAAPVLAAHVVDLRTTATWRIALASLVRAAELRVDGGPLLDLVEPLRARLDHVEPGRDQPARQRLVALAVAVAAPLTDARTAATALRPTARALAARLTGTLDRAAVDLAARAVDWRVAGRPDRSEEPDVGADLAALAARIGPYVDTAVDGLAAGLLPRLPRADGPAVRAALGVLAAEHTDGAAAAVGVVARAGAAEGWSPPWRALLADLRAHPDRRVAADARDVVTDPE